jgi:hypothetical protein
VKRARPVEHPHVRVGVGPARHGGEPGEGAEAGRRPLLSEAREDVVAQEDSGRPALLAVDAEDVGLEVPCHAGVRAGTDQQSLAGDLSSVKAAEESGQVWIGISTGHQNARMRVEHATSELAERIAPARYSLFTDGLLGRLRLFTDRKRRWPSLLTDGQRRWLLLLTDRLGRRLFLLTDRLGRRLFLLADRKRRRPLLLADRKGGGIRRPLLLLTASDLASLHGRCSVPVRMGVLVTHLIVFSLLFRLHVECSLIFHRAKKSLRLSIENNRAKSEPDGRMKPPLMLKSSPR